jgi:hypothetical protein
MLDTSRGWAVLDSGRRGVERKAVVTEKERRSKPTYDRGLLGAHGGRDSMTLNVCVGSTRCSLLRSVPASPWLAYGFRSPVTKHARSCV